MTVIVDPDNAIELAEHRYQTNALFHARVDLAVNLVKDDLRKRLSDHVRLNAYEESVVRRAAMLALLLAKTEPNSGKLVV